MSAKDFYQFTKKNTPLKYGVCGVILGFAACVGSAVHTFRQDPPAAPPLVKTWNEIQTELDTPLQIPLASLRDPMFSSRLDDLLKEKARLETTPGFYEKKTEFDAVLEQYTQRKQISEFGLISGALLTLISAPFVGAGIGRYNSSEK